MDQLAPHPLEDQTESQRRDLAELRALAMDIARTIAAATIAQIQATGAKPDAATLAPDRAFPNIARCIRLTVELERRLTRKQPDAAEAGPTNPARLERRRDRVRDKAHRLIEKEADPADAPILRRRVTEHLDGPDIDEELEALPAAEIALSLCRNLGMRCDPTFWPKDLWLEFGLRAPNSS